MEPARQPGPAEAALSLLFGKLHPLLEDAHHLLDRAARREEFEKLHQRLQKTRGMVAELLDGFAETAADPELAELIGALSANLTPLGEPLQQSLVLTQLCLEEAPKDLLPFAEAGSAAASAWGKRLVGFLQRLEDPEFQAKRRWQDIDPDLGEEEPTQVE